MVNPNWEEHSQADEQDDAKRLVFFHGTGAPTRAHMLPVSVLRPRELAVRALWPPVSPRAPRGPAAGPRTGTGPVVEDFDLATLDHLLDRLALGIGGGDLTFLGRAQT